MKHLALVLFSTAWLFACEAKDTTAPPAPSLDPVDSPTPSTSVRLSGSAEFGATVTISGGKAATTVISDPFTARWWADVELREGTSNELSVTATDAAGNVSLPATVTVVQAPSMPATISLSFSSPLARAGELVGLVTRVVDQYGHEMPDAAVTFTSMPTLAPSFTIPGTSPAVTKDQGVLAGTRQFVAYDLSAVAAQGSQFTVTATAGGVSTSEVLVVRPAPGATFSKLTFTGGQTTATVPAGTDVAFEYEVQDLYGNVTEGPVSAFTNAPGAIVLSDGVSGTGSLTRLNTAGSYSVLFYIAGVGQKGRLTLDVGVAPAAFVDVVAAATLASPNAPVDVFARVRDAYGNPVECSSTNAGDMGFSASGARGSTATHTATTCFNGAFRSSFTFTIEDTYTISATWQPAGATAVVGNVFISVLAFDNTPPTVTIQNIQVNGVLCTPASRTPAGCDVADGDTVTFELAAADTGSGLAEVAYSAFFESTQSLRTRTVLIAANSTPAPISFRFGVRTNFPEQADLVGAAVDRAGNRQNSAAVTLWTDRAFAVGNRTISVIASGGLVDRPDDVAFTENGDLYILSRAGNLSAQPNVSRVPAGSTLAQLAFLTTGFQGEFLERVGSGAEERLFLTDRNNQRLFTASPTAGNPQLFANLPGTPRGLAGLAASPARGWVDLTAAVATGDRVTLTQGGTTEAFEFDLQVTPTCASSATVTCVNLAGGGSAGQLATALATAMGGSTLASATASGNSVVLVSRTAGEASSSITLTRSGGAIVVSSPTLLEGHDADLFAANSNDSFVRRYLNTLTGIPFNGNHGQFNLGTSSWGIAVRDVYAPPARMYQDLALYAVDRNGGAYDRFAAWEVQSQGTPAVTTTQQRFTVTQTSGPGAIGFGRLWDIAVAPNGCVLVSDEANGAVYAIDVRAAPLSAPTSVERIARNLNAPRGLAIAPNGDLVIADDGANAVFRLTPTSDPTDCF